MEPELNQIDNINDIRDISEFKGITFSKCSKVEVRKTLLQNLSKGKIEPACHWCAELICAGHFIDVWETILFYFGKYIHLGNPKLTIYLESRYNLFKSIIEKGNYTTILQLRNNETIRKLFAEIICLLCQSKTKHSFEPIKINPEEDFDITIMSDRLKAPSNSFLEPFFLPKDPKVYHIAINEFAYCISSNETISACYWIEWIIEFETYSKKKKDFFYCERRSLINVDHCYQKDAIWIIWDAISHYGKEKSPFIQRSLSSLQNLFCIKYTTSSCKKRKYLLYFAVGLLIENFEVSDLQTDKNVLQAVISQINHVYKQIKKNEVSPNMDYLFNNINDEHKNNAEKSMKKLEMMDNIGF
jgi:hypothetical protein